MTFDHNPGVLRCTEGRHTVAASYRNEGLFRAGERIQSTGDFFRGGFMLPRSSAEFREIARIAAGRSRWE